VCLTQTLTKKTEQFRWSHGWLGQGNNLYFNIIPLVNRDPTGNDSLWFLLTIFMATQITQKTNTLLIAQ